MDSILQILLFRVVGERHARVCPSELPLSPSGLGCRSEVRVQFYRYYATRKGNVIPPTQF